MPSKEDFQRAVDDIFRIHEANGDRYVDITARELHRRVGEYPGHRHSMPICCDVMQRNMHNSDEVLNQPPKGKGASLKIRYMLPRKYKEDIEFIHAIPNVKSLEFNKASIDLPPSHLASRKNGTLIIVPCGEAKIWDKEPQHGPTVAHEAYISTYFRINKRFAEQFADKWIILSAKYGFIEHDFLIPGPYCVTFKKRSSNPVSSSIMQSQVHELGLHHYIIVIGLGGKDYRAKIIEAFAPFSMEVSFPFENLPIGKYMHAVNRTIKE